MYFDMEGKRMKMKKGAEQVYHEIKNVTGSENIIQFLNAGFSHSK